MIRCARLKKTYRMGDQEVRALDDVSLDIDGGEFVAIMGPSGSGKSTLLHVLGLLDTPDEGDYDLLGQNVARIPDAELAGIRGKALGFVFQQFNLLPRMTALENVGLPLIYLRYGAARAKPEEMLAEVGLSERREHRPNELSGGQQQRVAIARSLVNRPRIIFADEPTGNLDSKSQAEIMALFESLNARGITLVLVTHEEEIAARARRIIRMRDGKINSDERKDIRPATGPKIAEHEAGTLTASESRSRQAGRELWEHVRQAGRSLLANKIRTVLSVLGILIGVAAVIAMLALGRGAKESIEARLASMGSNLLVLRPGSARSRGVALEGGSSTRFTVDDAQEIRSLPDVRRVSPGISGRGQAVFASKNWNTQITGAVPDYADMHASRPAVGRFFTDADDQSHARVAVVGATIVRQLFSPAAGGEPVDPIGETIKINRVNFQVIGVLPEHGATTWRDEDDVILVPLSTAMKRLFGKDYVDDIDIEVDRGENMASVEDAVRQMVIRRHRLPPAQYENFQIRNMAQLQETLTETSRTMSTLLASIAAISLLVGGIGIMNIMLVSVTERTREIGLRKAIGARRKDILWQFLIEAVVVSVAGGVMGIFLGWLITLGMSNLAGWTASVSAGAVGLAFGFSIAVGVLFGLWPARKASRLSPIDALRYE